MSLERMGSPTSRRLSAWPTPPRWSPYDWKEEVRAHAAAAAWQAERDFDPARGVPHDAFVHQRVTQSVWTRYRQEWRYAARCETEDAQERPVSRPADAEPLRCALTRLSADDRLLIERLFWDRRSEADIARELGISQPAVSKRKRAALLRLRAWLDTL